MAQIKSASLTSNGLISRFEGTENVEDGISTMGEGKLDSCNNDEKIGDEKVEVEKVEVEKVEVEKVDSDKFKLEI